MAAGQPGRIAPGRAAPAGHATSHGRTDPAGLARADRRRGVDARSPQTIRIESEGLIIEFCDDLGADHRLLRALDPGVVDDPVWLHLRVRSDGLLAHAALPVSHPVLARFARDLDDLMQRGEGEAGLTGTRCHPSAIRLEADAGKARLTLMACPPLASRVRVVIEALDLETDDLVSIRRWAASHSAN